MQTVQVLGVHVDQRSPGVVVLLGDAEALTRVLPIVIGPGEAQAIVLGLADVETPRPGTHDLLIDVLEACSGSLKSVAVTELVDGTFLAEATLMTKDGESNVSARPSDAIAIAVRVKAPMMVADHVLDEAAVPVEHEADQPFDDEEVEAIMSEFEEFLSTATPEDFGAAQEDDDPEEA